MLISSERDISVFLHLTNFFQIRVMDVSQLESNVRKHISKEPMEYKAHKITVGKLPLTGLIRGAIPMIFILFAWFGCLMSYFILTVPSAIFVTLAVIGVNYLVTPPTGLKPGVVSARPETLLQSRISSALVPFVNYQPPWWCLDGHWATLLPLLLYKLPRRTDMLFQHLQSSDGCSLTLEWFLPSAPLKGVMLAIPGLNGSTNGGYMVDLVERMSVEGYAVAALNGRGSGCSAIETVESSFHLGRSDDLLSAIEGVEKCCDLPIYILGYSAGGVRAVTFAALNGEALRGRIAGVMSFGGSVSNTYTKEFPSSVFVYQPVIMHAYASTFLSKLTNDDHGIFEWFKRPFNTFVEFDARVTTQILKISLAEYYDQVFAEKIYENIAVPTLIVNAIDDPVLHVSDAIVEAMATSNSNVTLLATAKGGHIGWPSGLDAKKNGYKWISEVALSYISSLK